MPPVTFTEAFKEAVAVAPSGSILTETIVIDHSTFPAPFRLAKSEKNLVLDGNTYLGRQFKIGLPEMSAESNAGLNISVTDVDLAVSALIDPAVATFEPITVLYAGFLNTEVGPQVQFEVELEVKTISLMGRELSLTASYPDLINKKVPAESYETGKFRGLR